MPLIDALHADETRYVTRSVANHINDIAKVDADFALDLVERWRAAGLQHRRELDYIVRHATRSLVKQGNQRALRLGGANLDAGVELTQFVVPNAIALGGSLECRITLQSDSDAEAVVDYAIYFPTASGNLSRKVYKLRQLRLAARVATTIEWRHAFRANMTTRPIITGEHSIQILINGRPSGRHSFEVTVE